MLVSPERFPESPGGTSHQWCKENDVCVCVCVCVIVAIEFNEHTPMQFICSHYCQILCDLLGLVNMQIGFLESPGIMEHIVPYCKIKIALDSPWNVF